eukprot:CAMPEP_0206469594 /NCGR_PEP_ID=MMETSP0324_2-20121206/30379_1 /ASSEMBLY_ACC=CAM_ASM_000836 /TAXON_ID=2866 /ORGANISM="Crypthecodinium cohnii, Strain Seligo" /LENGTH=37 /DNA_ID= /DNA_START= /DNA_END= /DNA_ORIENTATION=
MAWDGMGFALLWRVASTSTRSSAIRLGESLLLVRTSP